MRLEGVQVRDEMPGLYGFRYDAWPGEEGVLEPGQSVTARAYYRLTAADVEARAVRNAATAEGRTVDGILAEDASAVVTPVGEVALTGADVGRLVGLALSLLLVGGVLVLGRRRSGEATAGGAAGRCSSSSPSPPAAGAGRRRPRCRPRPRRRRTSR